jgi:4-hydroxybenzoyl-CoA thioesterase
MFLTKIKVRFNHIDAAGIVFYPRYYEMFNQVVEEWCEQQLGYDFHQLEMQFGAGMPVVKIDAQFPNPSRLGDVLTFSLEVNKLGTSSIDITITAVVDGQKRVEANLVLVYILHSKPGEIATSLIPCRLRESILAT